MEEQRQPDRRDAHPSIEIDAASRPEGLRLGDPSPARGGVTDLDRQNAPCSIFVREATSDRADRRHDDQSGGQPHTINLL
jgi:hypothetical protein